MINNFVASCANFVHLNLCGIINFFVEGSDRGTNSTNSSTSFAVIILIIFINF